MKTVNPTQAAEIAATLHMPLNELLNVITIAGLAAVAKTLQERGKVTFPLSLETTGDQAPLIDAPDAPPAAPPFMMKELHPNSKAYAQRFAAVLRAHFADEETAAHWYRIIRAREIPALPELAAV